MVSRSTAIGINSRTEIAAKSEPLRAGIIGAGLMGRWHAHAVKKAGAQLAAIMDIDASLAQRLAAKYQDAEVFSEVEAMLNRADLDAVHICTPAATHYRIAKLGIAAGVNLIIEKPVTPMAADTEQLFAEAKAHKVLLCPAHQFVYQDGVIAAKKLLPRIGRIVDISATVISAGGEGHSGGELNQLVADILPHPLSLIQFLLPANFANATWRATRAENGELRAVCETGGVTLSIFISLNARPTANVLEIRGTQGRIYLNLFHGYAVMEPGRATRMRKIVYPFETSVRNLSAATLNLAQRTIRGEPAYPGLQRLVKSFYAAVAAAEPSPLSPEDTIAVARTRDLLISAAGLTAKQERARG